MATIKRIRLCFGSAALAFAIMLLAVDVCVAQLDFGGRPPSYETEGLNELNAVTLPSVNVDSLLAADKVELQEGKGFRFGFAIPVDLNLNNSGTWDTIPNFGRVWRLRVYSKDAKLMSINYDDFWLPPGSEFFVYNPNDTSEVRGAFTHDSNKPHGRFATGLMRSNELVLEYVEPYGVQSTARLTISSVVHVYRALGANWTNWEKGFGDAQPCQINTSCSEANSWRDQVRSVVLIAYDSTQRFCTGTVINNEREDEVPYIMTAEHCTQGEDISDWMFYFNYDPVLSDSTFGCDSTSDGTLSQSSFGGELKAAIGPDDASDVALILLDDTIPSYFNAFYAGWSRDTAAATSTVCIHHPSGDVKKFSFDEDGTSVGLFLDLWEVTYHPNAGTGSLEGGSSGAPLFDQNKRIIAAHNGTPEFHEDTLCSVSDHLARFGAISTAWGTFADSSRQLKHWLDPDNSGITTLDGFDPNQNCCIGDRGNVNGSGGEIPDIADLTYLVAYMFKSGPPPPCTEEGNVNGDVNEDIDVSDLTYLVNYQFKGGPAPPSCP